MSGWRLPIGAEPTPGGVRFRVWSPGSATVEVLLYGDGGESAHSLEPEQDGYFSAVISTARPGHRYRYRLDGEEAYPDPASRSQPEGVHGPSEIVDPAAYAWSDGDWRGRPLEELVIYELHVGTFTREGTFEAAAERLPRLVELGVTAVELMPVANFPGERNWGYDGVNLFAPATAYGGPAGMKRFVDSAHRLGLAVVLDVVYNHFGPEGNYIPAITRGHFFTERHETPWGAGINYDGAESRAVREFVIGNALHWVHEYHVDGLRLDATHAIVDDSEPHILAELAERVHAAASRPLTIIAEDDRNERLLVVPRSRGGYGLDAVWADDFHHQLRRLTAGDEEGYFASYSGTTDDLAVTLRKGWYYEGQFSPHRGAERGTPAEGIPPQRFVQCIQNHDQVGNRAFGERLNHEIDPAVYRAASALLLLSPATPMLWMGQEWAASSPFLYFTDHPEELGRLVTEGRRREFAHFSAFADPARRETIPDPQAPETFRRSQLHWSEREKPEHAGMLRWYRELLELRASEPALRLRDRDSYTAESPIPGTLVLYRGLRSEAPVILAISFAGPAEFPALQLRQDLRRMAIRLWSDEERFGGAGSPPLLEGGSLKLQGPGAVVLQTVLGA